MAIKRNKGELSEIYTLLHFLSQPFVFYGDTHAEKTDSAIFISKIQIGQTQIEITESELTVIDGGEVKTVLNRANFISTTELEVIFQAIKNGKGVFSNALLDEKLTQLRLSKSKSDAFQKADLHLTVLDKQCSFTKNVSIKSFIGGSPTLINASQATQFIFEITDFDVEKAKEVNAINSRSKIKDRLQKILDLNGKLVFKNCESELYQSTLSKINPILPQVVASALLSFYSKKSDLNADEQVSKNLLQDFALKSIFGIFPTQEWHGELSADSILLVKENGEILFYSLDNEQSLRGFLSQRLFFDTPSSTRHKFGSVYEQNGKFYIKLNLQLRLSK